MILYPRAACGIAVSLAGESNEVTSLVVPYEVGLHRRSHSQADTVEIELHGSAVPFDPRVIEGIFVTVFMGAVDSVDSEVNTEDYLRFVGYADEITPAWGEEGTQVKLKARDLSAILRDFKPIPDDAKPKYSDTLADAITRLINAAPAASRADLTLRQNDAVAGVQLSSVAPARAQSKPIALPRDWSLWQAIEYLCGLVSKLVSVEFQEVVVRDPSPVFTGSGRARATFVFGASSEGQTETNLLSVEQAKKFARQRKGVKVEAYDHATRARVEAVWPADEELPATRRPRRRGGAVLADAVKRDVYAAPAGISSPQQLEALARKIYEERSRQEIEGELVTPLWSNDYLGLKNADRVELRIHPALEAELQSSQDDSKKVALLRTRLGVEQEAAEALIRAANRGAPTDLWYCREITHTFRAEGVSEHKVQFINLIEVQ